MVPVRTGIARSEATSCPPKISSGPFVITTTSAIAAAAIARICGIASAAPISASISANIAE